MACSKITENTEFVRSKQLIYPPAQQNIHHATDSYLSHFLHQFRCLFGELPAASPRPGISHHQRRPLTAVRARRSMDARQAFQSSNQAFWIWLQLRRRRVQTELAVYLLEEPNRRRSPHSQRLVAAAESNDGRNQATYRRWELRPMRRGRSLHRLSAAKMWRLLRWPMLK